MPTMRPVKRPWPRPLYTSPLSRSHAMQKIEKLRCFLGKYPIKLLALFATFATSMNVGLVLLGYERSPFAVIACSLVAYIAASAILSSKETRQRLRDMLQGWASTITLDAIRLGVLMVAAPVAYAYSQSPQTPFMQQVMTFVELFGMLVIAIRLASSFLSFGSKFPVGRAAAELMEMLAVYALARWTVGALGDAAYQLAMENPDTALAASVALVICWISFARATPRDNRPAPMTSSYASSAAPRLDVTPRDRRYTAAHEAGHALVYAALGGLPANIRLVIKDQADASGTLGFVTGIASDHRLQERTFAEWHMLVLLAGQLGEQIMHGNSTLGSASDHMRWLDTAKRYLSNQYHGVFHIQPRSALEQEQNDAKLELLRTQQIGLLQAFFELNQEVHRQLTDLLLDKKMLGHDELSPLLDLAVFPEGFPMPFGPFSRFGEWPRG